MVNFQVTQHQCSGLPPELELDSDWYFEHYLGLVDNEGMTAANHYQTSGIALGLRPSPFLVPAYVIQQISQLGRSADGPPELTYLNNCTDIDPHVLLPRNPHGFRSRRTTLPDVTENWYNRSVHILRNFDDHDTRHSVFFDPSYMLDEAGSPIPNPLRWYLRHNAKSERRVSAFFDPAFYGVMNPSAKAEVKAGKYFSLLEHFLMVGMGQNLQPIADFDPDYYVTQYSDVYDAILAGQFASATEHFFKIGVEEGRNPNAFFDTKSYVALQPNVMEEMQKQQMICPFEHFLKVGSAKGYAPHAPLTSIHVPQLNAKALYERRCHATTKAILASGDPLQFPIFDSDIEISCVIPVHDQFEMTLHLLDQLAGIAQRRDSPAIEVVLVDDASSDQTVDLPRLTTGLTIVRQDTSTGYPLACNAGAAAARGKIIVFMNNDIEIGAHTLINAAQYLKEHPEIGALGPKILRMNGTIQEAGNVVFRNGSVEAIARDLEDISIAASVVSETDYCSGCCLFITKQDFDGLGGFFEGFSPGYYEETDLCFRLAEAGKKIIYHPDFHIYHYEFASYSKGRPPSASFARMALNQQLFVSRHEKRLAAAPVAIGHDKYRHLAKQRRLPTIAVIEDFLPDPAFGSGFGRCAFLINELRGQGYGCTVFALNYKYSKYANALRRIGVETVMCRGFPEGTSFLKGREWDFDYIWLCRTHNLMRIGDQVQQAVGVNPDLKVIFDTEALSCLRENARDQLKQSGEETDLISQVRAELMAPVSPRAIIAVNQIDTQAISQSQSATVIEIPHVIASRNSPPGIKHRQGIFFCGAFHTMDSPNYDGLVWFLDQVWPLIQQGDPTSTFTFAGYAGEGVDLAALAAGYQGASYAGCVDSLTPYYDAARVFIAPTRYAGGIPIKVMESMAEGVPTVCTSLLKSQLVLSSATIDDVPVRAASINSPQDFAQACLDLMTDDDAWRTQQSEAQRYVEKHASPQTFRERIREVFDA